MTNARNTRRTVWRILSGILAALVVLILVSLLYLSTVGFPTWLVTKLTGRISTGSFVLNAGSIKLDPRLGLVLNDTHIYRKRVVGPAAVDAGEVVLTLDPWAVMDKRICLKKITVHEGVFRFGMVREREPSAPTGKFDTKIRSRVELELDKCEVQGFHVEKLSCEFCMGDSTMRLENIKGAVNHDDLKGPDFTGSVTYDMDTGILDGQVVTLFDPHLLIPALHAWGVPSTAKLVKRFNFGETPPRFEAMFRRLPGADPNDPPDGLLNIAGKFRLEDCCTYNGVNILRGDSRIKFDLSATNSVLTINPILIFREEGLVKGSSTVDFKQQIVDFDAISTINPTALAQMIGAFTSNFMENFRFEGPTKIAAKGIVDYQDFALMDIEASVESKGLGIHKYVTDECVFTMDISGLTNTFSDIHGKIYGGKFTGSAQFVLPSGVTTNTSYMVEGEINNAELEKLVVAMMKEPKQGQDYCGKLSGRVRVEGFMGKDNGRTTAQGEGYVSIEDSRVFTLPLFGGFTHTMTKIIPGLDFILNQTNAKGEFKINDDKIYTGEFQIEGDVFSVNGRGDYYFNKNLDFKVQFKLLKEKTMGGKIVQFIIAPLSKILEFRLVGSLDKPSWYLRTFSRTNTTSCP